MCAGYLPNASFLDRYFESVSSGVPLLSIISSLNSPNLQRYSIKYGVIHVQYLGIALEHGML